VKRVLRHTCLLHAPRARAHAPVETRRTRRSCNFDGSAPRAGYRRGVTALRPSGWAPCPRDALDHAAGSFWEVIHAAPFSPPAHAASARCARPHVALPLESRPPRRRGYWQDDAPGAARRRSPSGAPRGRRSRERRALRLRCIGDRASCAIPVPPGPSRCSAASTRHRRLICCGQCAGSARGLDSAARTSTIRTGDLRICLVSSVPSRATASGQRTASRVDERRVRRNGS
jgi:hypothetical protein